MKRYTSSATSAQAALAVRNPLNLAWLGTAFYAWDSISLNWDSNGDVAADAAYTEGDNVRFDDNGANAPTIDVSNTFHPSSVVVTNSAFDYLFSTTGAGGITRNTGLTKQGTAALILDIDNTYTGPTLIQQGTITVGYAGARGTLGTGPVTNNGVLFFDRTGTMVLSNSIAGSGQLVKSNSLSLVLTGTNVLSGQITVGQGNVTVDGSSAGNPAQVVLYGFGAGNGTSLTLATNAVGQGPTFGAGTTFSLNPADVNNRCAILAYAPAVLNSPILLNGAGPAIINNQDNIGPGLQINGAISGSDFTDYISFRGVGSNNVLRSHFNLPQGGLQKDDSCVWLLHSTGNVFKKLRMLGTGVLRLGNDNALDPAAFVETDRGTLDLAGFNQTVIGLVNDLPQAGTTVANSSTTSDSRLSLVNSLPDTWGPSAAIIADSVAGGTRKVSLTINIGGVQVLTNAGTYSGDTTITAGTLALSANGALLNSTPILLAAGAILDVSGRTDGTLTLGASQTLTGSGSVQGNLIVQGTLAPGQAVGTLSVSGNVSLGGTAQTVIEANLAAATNDLFQVGGTLTYGGKLTITNLSATPYLPNQVIKLFNAAGGYGGSFASIYFPGVAAYDASNLAVDGTIKVIALVSTVPVNVSAALTGGNTLHLSWPPDHTTWRLLAQTNAPGAGLTDTWFYVQGSGSTNQLFIPLDPAVGSVFYRLAYP